MQAIGQGAIYVGENLIGKVVADETVRAVGYVEGKIEGALEQARETAHELLDNIPQVLTQQVRKVFGKKGRKRSRSQLFPMSKSKKVHFDDSMAITPYTPKLRSNAPSRMAIILSSSKLSHGVLSIKSKRFKKKAWKVKKIRYKKRRKSSY